MGFRNFLQSNKIYNPGETEKVLSQVMTDVKAVALNKKIKYLDVPCAFDIETSSFYNGDEKVSIMYEWTLGINGAVIIGRTWDDLMDTWATIIKCLSLDSQRRLIIYVHNLGYEFQFIRLWMEWDKVFSVDTRKPIYAVTQDGIEFRCSYILSGYSLAKLGDELKTYKVHKMVGDLDYNLIRHSDTPLTDAELGYCVMDVKVVMAYIKEQCERHGNITRLPLTNTGYVRNFVRNSCFYVPGQSKKKSRKKQRYMELMKSLRIYPDEYKQLKRAFQGGFTHANPFYSGKVVHNVTSVDFTSSYPSVMVAEQFPMSSAQRVNLTSKEDFVKNLKYYCCLFDAEFVGLESKIWNESYISRSRCWGVEKAVINNGRVVSAKKLYTTLTEQDFFIISKFYSWDHLRIGNFKRYKKGYLPTDFVKAILKLYQDKTTLKGVQGKEVEYLQSKGMLNSCYGMAVTDIVRDEITYTNNEWGVKSPDLEKALNKYNLNSSRFLYYPWGVWVTAYARRNLFTGIYSCGNDYVYSDTDSIKIINAERHQEYINKYNDMVKSSLLKAMKWHGLSPDLIAPKTIKGVTKLMGVWDDDGFYKRFKTLGAKRYMVEDDQGINITVSGLNKKITVPYMMDQWGNDVFTKFDDDLYIPPEFTGKNTHTYIDDKRAGIVTDYLGTPYPYYEKSSVHLEQSDYHLSISQEYADYLSGILEL